MNEYMTTADDTPRIRAIWEACFDDTKEFGDWFFTHRYSPEQTLSIRENGEILSNVQMIPYRVRIRGAELSSWFIVGAATMPEARKKGHMSALLEASFRRMRQAGVFVTHLYPFQYDFYRKFGYDICSERLLQRLSPSDILNSLGVREAAKWPAIVRELGERAELEALAHCYETFMRNLDGYVVRDVDSFRLRLMEHAVENGGGFTAWRNGELCAYALYALQDNKIICPETVYAHPLDLMALLRALASRFDGVDTIEFSTPVTDTVRYMLRDGRSRVYIEPFDMFRIVDFAALIESCVYPATVNGEWVIEIRDAQAPWNEGRWRIQISGGRAQVSLTDASGDFSCGIGDMVPVISGLVRTESMGRCRRLRYRDYDKLMQFGEAFPSSNPYLFEMY